MQNSKVEQLILKNLLQLVLLGVLLILIADIALNIGHIRSMLIDMVILAAILTSFALLKYKKFKTSVVLCTTTVLFAMLYQLVAFQDSAVPLAVILVLGFGYSALLKVRLMLFMHIVTVIGCLVVFDAQRQHPEIYLKSSANEIVTRAITFMILYFIVSFSAAMLKRRYNSINGQLKLMNQELLEKSNEIETQNEQLVQSQNRLHVLNQILEQSVEERTHKVIQQNEQLLKYAHMNAHDVRGPIARVLGLIQLSKIDESVHLSSIVGKIEYETREIDAIISRINEDLEKNN